MQYSGPAMVAAKAVVDAAQGGMVLLHPGTFQQASLLCVCLRAFKSEGLGRRMGLD